MDPAAQLAQRINLLGPWLRRRFGGPVAKIGLDAGLGCPNRDPGRGLMGCAYCPPGGSSQGQGHLDITQQLAQGLERLAARQQKPPPQALAYFQAHTSTHGPVERLAPIFQQALDCPGLSGLIVSTRPDCLDAPRWNLLSRLAEHGPFWLELGLQSAHAHTLKALGRGHGPECFAQALAQARGRGIPVVAHVILGLPGETPADSEYTARFLAGLGPWGVKLHHLMVLEGAPLAQAWRQGQFRPWTLAEWAQAAAGFLALLPPQMVVHRLLADPGPERLLAPEWTSPKALALRALAQYMLEHDLKQGAWHGREPSQGL